RRGPSLDTQARCPAARRLRDAGQTSVYRPEAFLRRAIIGQSDWSVRASRGMIAARFQHRRTRMVTNIRMTSLTLLLTVAAAGWAADPDEAWVKAEVRRLRDSDANAWKRVPWTASLPEARNASRAEGRPLLLFSYEGNIETG